MSNDFGACAISCKPFDPAFREDGRTPDERNCSPRPKRLLNAGAFERRKQVRRPECRERALTVAGPAECRFKRKNGVELVFGADLIVTLLADVDWIDKALRHHAKEPRAGPIEADELGVEFGRFLQELLPERPCIGPFQLGPHLVVQDHYSPQNRSSAGQP